MSLLFLNSSINTLTEKQTNYLIQLLAHFIKE